MKVLIDKFIIEKKMVEAEVKALRALGGYKFWMFGYHAANWVKLNQMLDSKKSNPFKPLVMKAREMRGLPR